MKKVAIIHFQPLELYPPIINFLNLIGKRSDCIVTIFTTYSTISNIEYTNPHVRIIKWGTVGAHISFFRRFWYYIKFNLGTTLKICKLHPSTVFYFESYSAFPAVIYQLLFPKTRLFIHYHEYHEKNWYASGMKTVKWFHALEQKITYPKAQWISQTNKDRLQMFLKDNEITFNAAKHFVFPNYPPQSWKSTKENVLIQRPVRLVYVGSFGSMNSLYIQELLTWIKSLEGKVILDIYSYVTTELIKTYIESLDCTFIQLKEPLNYSSLPKVLKFYDVGLIIYKGVDKNFIYNAPNKLFEYLACELDVWFPEVMAGVMPYKTFHSYPKVIDLDFTNLKNFCIEEGCQRNDLQYKPSNYFCEDVIYGVINRLTGHEQIYT